jgi:A/G-specific adenine glycosylase
MVEGHRVGRLLVQWYRRGHRDLPWRANHDPYRVWISEIMLQQTRAQAVIPYYHRFLERFPTVEALAAAREEEVLTAWSGLGYYSRARNLRPAAAAIVAAGAFPRDYEALRGLAGVGDYTAAAIASIAFGAPRAAIDGNVLRVVARVENDASDIGNARVRERFREVAQGWLDHRDPGTFNQAMMELGATVCLPRNPLCLVCPISTCCRAREHGTSGQLPVKLRRMEPVSLAETLLVVHGRRGVLLHQRAADSRRMAGFWDLPSPEHLPQARIGAQLGAFRHTITHHHYTFTVYEASIRGRTNGDLRWFRAEELEGIPLSTTARKGLKLAREKQEFGRG